VDAEQLGQEQDRDALEQRGAEPAVSTKRLTWRGRRSSSSATLIAVGRVAFDDAVENAVTMASLDPRKKASGFMPPRSFTDSE